MGRSDRRLGARRGAAGQARTTAAGQFSCADMKLSAAQVLGREDEDEALTDHGPPPSRRRRHHCLRGRHNRRHRRPAALFATAALFKPCRRRHHQPARVAGSNGTLTIGSAEVVWVSKACTHLTKGSHIKGAAEDEGSLNKCGSSQYLCLRNGLLEAQNVKKFRCAAKKRGAFHCKGGSARKTRSTFFEFSPYHTFLLHLIRSTVVFFNLRLSGRSLSTTQFG